MTETGASHGRRSALGAALDAVPALWPHPPQAVLPITGAQWRRSVVDADLDDREAAYRARRERVTSMDHGGRALGRRLRPATLELAAAARELCAPLRVLATLDPGISSAGDWANTWRRIVAEDVHAVLLAAIEDGEPPPAPARPASPDVPESNRDVLLALFGIASEEITDDAGSFCDSRVLALYRRRLPELQKACDPLLALVADHPPSVFTAVSAARDLATSASPWVTVWCAREVRTLLLSAFDANRARTQTVLAEAMGDADKEWSAFVRVTDRLGSAERAMSDATGTERDRAVAILEAYKHMAEGLTRRWVWVLLRLTGVNDPPPTVGTIGATAAARLGELGARVEAALVPAMRNAEAHEDFTFDEDTGRLLTGHSAFLPDEILARLTDLDILQRAFIVGRLAAFADQPNLGGTVREPRESSSATSAMSFARQRFGHAGQRVRSFVRDRDRLDVVIDGLRPEACNPCFVALTQAAQMLPTVTRFVVRVSDREDPIIDVTSGVLHENWSVFQLAATYFPDALPPETFLPSLTWVRLACEAVDEAARVAAWMALNDAQHAVVDAEVSARELLRLPRRLELVGAAVTSTLRVLPRGAHVDALRRAHQIVSTTASALMQDGPYSVTTNVLMNRILPARDRLGGPPAVLPTLDPRPLAEGSYPHDVS